MLIADRDYQATATQQTIPGVFKSGRMALIAVAPVGAGKTIMMAQVAADTFMKGRADFWHIAHRRELIEQPFNKLAKFNLPVTRVLAGERPDPASAMHVASVATLANRPLHKTRRMAIVSVDEGHRVVGPSYMKLLDRFYELYGREHVYVLVWTATPYRLDGRSLGDVADSLIEITTPTALFEKGLLMEPTVIGFDEPDMSGVNHRGGDFVREAVAERVDKPRIVGNVVDQWLKHSHGEPSVYFACSIAHSHHVVDRFLSVGIRAAHLDGETPLAERSRILARLAIGGRGSDHPEALDVVVNVDVLREGWDSESDYDRVLADQTLWLGKSHPPAYVPLAVLGDLDPTESCCAYRQREGRVCRTHARKRRALLLSHSGNWKRHGFLRHHYGFVLDAGDTSRKNLETIQQRTRAAVYSARHCPACLSVWPPTTETCSCGQALGKPPELPEEDDSVQLSEIKNPPYIAPPNPSEERLYLRGLWLWWKRNNTARVANGKKPVAEMQIRVLFNKRYNRWPAQQMMLDARRDAGV